MIRDTKRRNELIEQWISVRHYEAMIHNCSNELSSDAAFPRDDEYFRLTSTLLVLHVFSVLEDVLKEIKNQGTFSASDRANLNTLMEKSKSSDVPWKDFDGVMVAKKERNDAAHNRLLLTETGSREIIDLIDEELHNWNVIPSRMKRHYKLSATEARFDVRPTN